MEGVATVYEVIHYSKKRRCNGYLLKLDFERVYGGLELLVGNLVPMGFRRKIIIVVRHVAQDCQNTNSSKWQGWERDSVEERIETRGFLSPILFVPIVDGLNHMFRKLKEEGLIQEMVGAPLASYVNLAQMILLSSDRQKTRKQ